MYEKFISRSWCLNCFGTIFLGGFFVLKILRYEKKIKKFKSNSKYLLIKFCINVGHREFMTYILLISDMFIILYEKRAVIFWVKIKLFDKIKKPFKSLIVLNQVYDLSGSRSPPKDKFFFLCCFEHFEKYTQCYMNAPRYIDIFT